MLIAISILDLDHKLQNRWLKTLEPFFTKFIAKNTHINFIILKNKNCLFTVPDASNCFNYTFKNNLPNGISKYFFTHYTVPLFIKKQNANLVININATSINYKQLQLHLIENCNSKNILKIKKEDSIVCFSNTVLQNIVDINTSVAGKCILLNPLGFTSTSTITANEKQQTIDGFANGRNYFLADVLTLQTNEIVALLKSFSAFKKWQHSNMKMLLLNCNEKKQIELKLETYKYKDDVVLLEDLNTEQEEKIVASAYTFIYTNMLQHLPHLCFVASLHKVAIISLNKSIVQELYKDSVLYATLNEENNISQQLILTYKDETLHKELSNKAYTIIANANPNETIATMCKLINTNAGSK